MSLKHILRLLLSSLLLLSLISCGGGGSEVSDGNPAMPESTSNSTAPASEQEVASEKITLTAMMWSNTDQMERITAQLMEATPELTEKYEIEWIIGGQGDGEIAEKIRLALSSNEPVADFACLNYTQVPEFAKAGVLTDVSASIELYKNELVEGALAISQYEGKTIAFPFELKPRVWFYRADIFEEAGVDVAQVKDVDDLIAAGKKIQAVRPESYIWNLGPAAAGYDFYLTLSGNGARFSDDEGNYNIASDPGVRAMLEDYKKLVDSGVVMNVSDWTTDWENAFSQETLVSELSAGWLAQRSFISTYASEQTGKWAAGNWPTLGGSAGGSDAGGSVFVIPSFARYPNEAADFLSHFTLSENGTLAVFQENATTPINTKAWENELVQEPHPYFGETLLPAQIKGLEELKVFDYSPKAAAEMDIVIEYFIKAVYSELTIDDALQQAQNDLEQMLGNAYE